MNKFIMKILLAFYVTLASTMNILSLWNLPPYGDDSDTSSFLDSLDNDAGRYIVKGVLTLFMLFMIILSMLNISKMNEIVLMSAD